MYASYKKYRFWGIIVIMLILGVLIFYSRVTYEDPNEQYLEELIAEAQNGGDGVASFPVGVEGEVGQPRLLDADESQTELNLFKQNFSSLYIDSVANSTICNLVGEEQINSDKDYIFEYRDEFGTESVDMIFYLDLVGSYCQDLELSDEEKGVLERIEIDI